MPIILDGKAIAAKIQRQLAADVEALKPRLGRAPGLAVVLVGDNPASEVYVRSKTKNAISCGIAVKDLKLPRDVSNETLQNKLFELSQDQLVDGILLQLPLPPGLDEYQALLAIDPRKDVDGLHPLNQGLLMRGIPGHQACTPLGVMRLIAEARGALGQSTDLSGLHAVVVGRSILVGKPASLMLLSKNCTVEICHSRTADLEASCGRADILVAAIGKPNFITGRHVKKGAIVIDVGINRTSNGELCGDVDFKSASAVASAITPVPGGVGPMTIAMLLSNTVNAGKRFL